MVFDSKKVYKFNKINGLIIIISRRINDFRFYSETSSRSCARSNPENPVNPENPDSNRKIGRKIG